MGLAAASIFLFLFFFIRRRRRQQRLEHDTAVASTLAAAGFGRGPVDGDDEDGRKGMRQRRGSSPFGVTTTSSLPSTSAHNSLGAVSTLPYRDDPPVAGHGRDFDPYAAYGQVPPPPTAVRRDGYMPARTSSPPPGAAPVVHAHHHSLSGTSTSSAGHMQRESAGSFEPLLGGFKVGGGGSPPRTPNANPNSSNVSIPPPPPRNPARLSDAGRTTKPVIPTGTKDNGGISGSPTGKLVRDSASSVYSGEEEDYLDELTAKFQPALEVRRAVHFFGPIYANGWTSLRYEIYRTV